MSEIYRGLVPKGHAPQPPVGAKDAIEAARELNDSLDPDAAMQVLRAALEHDPTDHAAVTELALTLLDVGRTDEGVDALESFLVRNPKSAEARLALVRCLLRSGDYERAIRECRVCMQERPNWDAPHQPLITALCKTERREEARNVLQDLGRFQPDPRRTALLQAMIDRA